VRLSVDVVVVTYNHFELTESCLRHLAAQTREHRLIVVDNGSTDDTRARLAAEWPAAHVVGIEGNGGFAVACNRGVAAGSGNAVVLLNNCLDRLVAPLEADARLGSVCALSVKPGEERIDSVGMTADPTLAAFQRLHDHPVGEADAPQPVLTGPAGAIAAYRRTAWEQAGGLEEALHAYMEDFDLALRMRAAGWGTTVATDAVGVHIGSATFGHRSPRQRRLGGFARGYMLRRYGVLRGPLAARALLTEAIVVLGDLVLSRDALALRGRLAGWRAARDGPRYPLPAAEVVDHAIDFRASLQMRRGVYRRPPA
jgi:N-acetylglucosaminyl-diphospho-decaprenol L-rhamnosyltransferase